MTKPEYDIIIAGGGPAGLSAAAKLSKTFSVLLIEKNELGTTFASWYSYEDRIKAHNLEDAVAFRSDYLHFVAPTLQHDMKDNCVVLDHNKTLQIWIDRARNNGANFVQGEFLSYLRKSQDFVVVETTNGTFTGKLLIDACGSHSPVIRKHNLVKRVDAWIIYGAKIRVKNNTRRVQIEYYPLNDNENTYVGIHPFNENEINFYVFIGENGTFGNDYEKLKPRFNKILAETYPDAEVIAPLYGSIPSGILKKYALDNVVFWGASGMLNPDGCGMGFNEILRQLDTFEAEITRTFRANRLDKWALGRVALGLHDIETLHFQRIIGAFSLYFRISEGRWDGGVKWLNAMGNKSKYWMRNEMSLSWIRDATIRLHKAVPFKETIKMIPPNELLFISEQLVRFSFSAVFVNTMRFLGFSKK
jgi:hypothetical protein